MRDILKELEYQPEDRLTVGHILKCQSWLTREEAESLLLFCQGREVNTVERYSFGGIMYNKWIDAQKNKLK